MFAVSGELEIDRPVEAVFDFLTDLDRYPAWQTAIERAELLGMASPRPGTRFRLHVRALGRQTELGGEIVAIQRPRELAIRLVSGPARVNARCSFDATADGRSRLRLDADIQPTGLLRFGEAAIRDRVSRELPGALASLRADVERHVPDNSTLLRSTTRPRRARSAKREAESARE